MSGWDCWYGCTMARRMVGRHPRSTAPGHVTLAQDRQVRGTMGDDIPPSGIPDQRLLDTSPLRKVPRLPGRPIIIIYSPHGVSFIRRGVALTIIISHPHGHASQIAWATLTQPPSLLPPEQAGAAEAARAAGRGRPVAVVLVTGGLATQRQPEVRWSAARVSQCTSCMQ